ncbi:MAG: dienelactone hydrolase family protein [Deltaproteobacteria bacterium]|nr:MAG: dienelactone hydrolase family protein [Deltaproteobacteria bacterium]
MLTLLTALLIAQGHVHEAGDAATASGTYSAAMAAQPHPLDPDAPKPKGSMTELKIGDQTSKAYVARPKGKPQGALLVIHEYWGLNDWVKDKADQLAAQGYLALAIDLYKGEVATDPKQAAQLMQAKDEKWGDQVEAAGLEWLKKNAQGANVAIIGWCMGGGEALKASLNEPDNVDATIIHYGMPVLDVARLKVLHGPVLGIWANKDRSITPEKVAQFDQALTEAGVKHEFHAYDADHAFANPSGGRYNGEAAKDAWDKTLKFLAANLRK